MTWTLFLLAFGDNSDGGVASEQARLQFQTQTPCEEVHGTVQEGPKLDPWVTVSAVCIATENDSED